MTDSSMMFWLACMFSVDLVIITRDFGWLQLRANRYPYFIMEILLRVHTAYTDMRFFWTFNFHVRHHHIDELDWIHCWLGKWRVYWLVASWKNFSKMYIYSCISYFMKGERFSTLHETESTVMMTMLSCTFYC